MLEYWVAGFFFHYSITPKLHYRFRHCRISSVLPSYTIWVFKIPFSFVNAGFKMTKQDEKSTRKRSLRGKGVGFVLAWALHSIVVVSAYETGCMERKTG